MDENGQYLWRKSTYLWNDLRNFNEVFRKDERCDL